MSQRVPFCEMVRASGAAEPWTHSNDPVKFQQFGWRCTNNESLYRQNTLIGNWSEERSDVSYRKIPEPIPSQYGHYFDTIHNSSYNEIPKTQVPKVLKNCRSRHSHSFPSHQPEFDSDQMKSTYNSWLTTQRADYLDPKLRRQPIVVNSLTSPGKELQNN